MPKGKQRQKKKAVVAADQVEAPPTPPSESQHNPETLLAHAQKALDDCHPELAHKFLTRALEIKPNDVTILEALGVTAMEEMTVAGESGEDAKVAECALRAKEYFLQAVNLAPAVGYPKFLYLGQMSGGKEALEYYQRGMEVLEHQIKAGGISQDEESALRRRASEALCSMTEIYMTDCCDEPEAESSCESYTAKAITYDPKNPEAYQSLASVRMSQSRPDDARIAIQQSMDIWIDSSSDQSDGYDGHANWPEYAARLATAKILLELSMHERALLVLQTCLLEDEEDPEGWYLNGWCYYLIGQTAATEEMAHSGQSDNWAAAAECFENILRLNEKYGNNVDPEIIEHCQNLLSEINPYLAEHPPAPSAPDDGTWQNEDDDDMEES
ncbi:hypothetical protein DFS34DRAFT_199994 [Phlyctochytrium arcticum]|nr:hypothetical protein DFS34DRAFT_199994 [Phlyctochytrium arcticum]